LVALASEGRIDPRIVVAGATLIAALVLAAPADARIVRAQSILPPGESGFVSLAGLASGSGSPHLYDQQHLFIDFRRKDARFDRAGTEEDPKPGVKIVRDRFGVPAITGKTTTDLWWGAGYATAQDRLFELEVFRRATTGHLAEILGKSYLPMDIETRRDFYTPQELGSLFAKLPAGIRSRYRSYLAGANAWVSHVQASPQDMPGEFAAVADPLQPFTVEDLLAIGVYLARTTPNGDGSDLDNARALDASGPRRFTRILPLRVPGQISTVPRSEGLFPSDPGRTHRDERIALRRSTRFVRKLPLPVPGDLGTEPHATEDQVGGAAAAALTRSLRRPIDVGGSYMTAIGDGSRPHALLFNGPELGFSAPEELYEMELHGPGLDVRGITAPGAPVIAIGFNRHVAFGLTSGLSGTNALYAEKLVPGHPDEYHLRGRIRRMTCHKETFDYRSPPTDLLGGSVPGAGQETYRLCRTVHGPVQERAGNVAYARRYATWKREADTIIGLSRVDTAGNVRQVDRAVAKVTWNENLMAADDHGHIGYWHPGLNPIRPRRWDERLPYPGTGKAEWRGFLPVAERPHVIDPKQGWLTNWNNIPSQGWTTANDPASERVAGRWFRVGWFDRQVKPLAGHPTFKGLQRAIHSAGTTAQQRPLATRLLRRALRRAHGGAATVLRTILAWDGSYDRQARDGTVSPGVAAWQTLKEKAQRIAIAPLGRAGQIIGGEGPNDEHDFDVSLGQAYALRTLGPSGIRRAAKATFQTLVKHFGNSEPATWREPRDMFDQAALGAEQPPPMPFFDRGTYEQLIELAR
jgi:penicillin G amidase